MSFNTALSGLNAAQSDLRVISNNVANASTSGFKASRAEFADVYAASNLGTAQNAIGAGVRLSAVSQQFTQGNINFTDNNLDLAINGQGFFRLNDNGSIKYSRAGAFQVDRNGYIVNSLGQQLTAFGADASGNITGALGSLQLDTSNIAPSATTTLDTVVNLDASANIPYTPTATDTVTISASSSAAAAATLNITSSGSGTTVGPVSQTVYDSQGGTHTLGMTFTQTTSASTVWDVSVTADGTALAASPLQVTFSSSGSITDVSGSGGSTYSMTIPNAPTPSSMSVTLDLSSVSGATSSSTALYELQNGAPQGGFDPTDPNSYNSSTSLTVYDSLGSSHLATLYYRKNGIPNQWQVYTLVDGTDVSVYQTDPVTGQNVPDLVTFGTDGSLSAINGNPIPPATLTSTTFTPTGTAGSTPASMTLTQNLADITQYGTDFSVFSLSQDGYTTGRLAGISVGDSGIITANYSNGQSKALGQVALANFSNPQGLNQNGDTQWVESYDSGPATVGAPGTASLGLIQSGSLEDSNTDISSELVKMITAQRNYQANAQVIKTDDQITQTIINIR